MSTPSQLSAALDDIWQTLASAPWRTNPREAEKAVQSAHLRLRKLALALDPESWPRDVKTFLWRHPEHTR